jgi:hypothetical protein
MVRQKWQGRNGKAEMANQKYNRMFKNQQHTPKDKQIKIWVEIIFLEVNI